MQASLWLPLYFLSGTITSNLETFPRFIPLSGCIDTVLHDCFVHTTVSFTRHSLFEGWDGERVACEAFLSYRQVYCNVYHEFSRSVPVVPDPNPCDIVETNTCSPQGSQCSVMNTLPGESIRCTCLTGYVGDGKTCKGKSSASCIPKNGFSTPLS